MLVSVLIGLTLVLSAAPVRTAYLYDAAWKRQDAQIAVDNAAIVGGRADRALFRWVASANRLLDGLEAAHHAAHACARVPGPQAVACRTTDLSLEATIRSIHASVGRSAGVTWRANRLAALASAAKRHVPVFVRRPSSVPLRPRRCAVCGLDRAWDPTSPRPLVGVFFARVPANDPVRARLVSTASGWDYELGETF